MRALLGLWVLTLVACAGAPPAGPKLPEGYPGELLTPAQMQPDQLMRQKLEATYGEREVSFEAVVQKKGEALTIIGLTPFGAKAFVLQQRGGEFEYTPHLAGELPFPPRYILLDLQRAYFMGLPDSPRADGDHEGERAGERIRERWSGGRLQERTFERLDAQPTGLIRIRYEGGHVPGEAPPVIDFENGWFGYRLRIATVEHRPL